MVNPGIKWIKAFLVGKREEKDRKRARSLSSESGSGSGSSNAIVLPAPGTKDKPRWSLKKSASKNKLVYRRNSSFDDVYTNKLVKQALEEHEMEQIRVKAILRSRREDRRGLPPALLLPSTIGQSIVLLKDLAALKIQCAFRAYLARRALRSLKALVKLQAVVRGHLVRKQTTAILRGMHALMTIQVRARVKRVQRTQVADHLLKTTSQPQSSTHNQSDHKTQNNDKMHKNSVRTPNTKSNNSQAENSGSGFNKYHSTIIRHEDGHERGRNSLDRNTRIDREYDAVDPKKKIPNSPDMSKTKQTKNPAAEITPNYNSLDLILGPSYIPETNSSNKKASVPKQRPTWSPKHMARRSISTEYEYIRDRDAPCQIEQKRSQSHPWFFRFYRSAKSVKDSDMDPVCSLRKSSSMKAKSIYNSI